MGVGALFFTSLVVGLSGAMAPGSLLVVNVQAVLEDGFKGSLKTVVGHALSELFLVLLMLFGLTALLAQEATAAWISLAGSVMLLWFGTTTVKDSLRGKYSLDLNTATVNEKHMPYVLRGVIATVSNPYWLLWWATIGASYFVLAENAGSPIAVFFLGHISADFLWYSLIALLLLSGKKFISDKVYRYVLAGCGVFLVFLSIYFFYSGIKLLN